MGSLTETNPSLWVETSPADAGAAFAPLDADLRVDVAVVGAGIAGLSTAMALAERGADVALLEAGRLCSGVTAYTTWSLRGAGLDATPAPIASQDSDSCD